MGFMCGGEFIQDSCDLMPADDAGIRYDAECAGYPEEEEEVEPHKQWCPRRMVAVATALYGLLVVALRRLNGSESRTTSLHVDYHARNFRTCHV